MWLGLFGEPGGLETPHRLRSDPLEPGWPSGGRIRHSHSLDLLCTLGLTSRRAISIVSASNVFAYEGEEEDSAKHRNATLVAGISFRGVEPLEADPRYVTRKENFSMSILAIFVHTGPAVTPVGEPQRHPPDRRRERFGTMRLAAMMLGATGLFMAAVQDASAQGLPPEIRMDRYIVQAERQSENGRLADALRTLDLVLELRKAHALELPESFWMTRAEIALAAEDYLEAMTSATRYLAAVGRGGGLYAAALEVLDGAVAQGCTPGRMTQTLESVRACSAAGADPNALGEDGRTALDWAAERGDPAMTAALVEAGADPALAAERARRDNEDVAARTRRDNEVRAERARRDAEDVADRARRDNGESAARARREMRSGTVFRDDCAACPAMVMVPAGSFLMGSPPSERGRSTNEGPRPLVTIGKPFAVGVYEVTWTEWDACVRAAGCRSNPHDQGWGRGVRPVIGVTWNDAREYVLWLSRETGEEYRLLTEAEWEYVARAGSTTARYWGEDESGQYRYANTAEPEPESRGGYTWGISFRASNGPPRRNAEPDEPTAYTDGFGVGTAPVGSFQPNGFGLYDVLGNVWEWTADCWNGSYAGAPADGSAWEAGDCSRRVARGGSWHNPENPRAADRTSQPYGSRFADFGFRVARSVRSFIGQQDQGGESGSTR